MKCNIFTERLFVVSFGKIGVTRINIKLISLREKGDAFIPKLNNAFIAGLSDCHKIKTNLNTPVK